MKIALLGSAPSSIGKAPFHDSAYKQWAMGRDEKIQQAHASVPGDWDIWGCSPGCWAVAPRANRWFEVHRWEAGVPWFSPEYVAFLKAFKGIVYTGGAIPEIPNHEIYPIDEMEEKFASYFFTSSLALMLALAIDTIEKIRVARKGIAAEDDTVFIPYGVNSNELEKEDNDDVIGMWGVDMAATEEYAYQRPGCQFFILEALRRGIGVYLPPESDLMRPMPVYGISEWDHNYIKLTQRARELNRKAEEAQRQLAPLQAQVTQAGVAQAELNAFVNTWTSPYGMPHGMIMRQVPGTGLGSGVTHVDGRPITRPARTETRMSVLAMTGGDKGQMEDPAKKDQRLADWSPVQRG